MTVSRAHGLALLTAAAVSLAGCGAVTMPDAAVMPRTAGGTPELSDQGAIQTASYALGSPSRTAGQPGEAARALASIDFLAGELYSNPHWVAFPVITKQRMLQARIEVRQVLAVAPGTSSQVVVDQLLRAANAFEGHDIAAALSALPASVFTLGPDRTAALLANLPYLQQANVAAQAANYDITYNCETGNCS